MLLNSSVASAQIRVAVEDGSANGTGNEIVDQLNANTNHNFDATLVFSTDIDTVQKLNDYDVVIVSHSGMGPSDQDWTVQM